MLVLPGVNEKTFKETKARFLGALDLVKDLSQDERWIHVDVTNGTFTPNSFWNDVKELPNLKKLADAAGVKVEIHLMVSRPEWSLGDWLKAGADRIIIHLEAMEFKGSAMMLGDSVVIGIIPETPVEQLIACAKYAKQVMFLAVSPGPSGQSFDEGTLEKIKTLHKELPNVTISVDGGVNNENAPRLKDAGASVLVSTSYIWGNGNPKEVFERLRSL